MERDHVARGRGAAKAWEPVAAANAVAGAVAKAKGGEAKGGEAEGEARAAAVAKTQGQQKAPAQPIRQTKKNQSHKRKETIMPGGDQTGPMSQGPMTGRGLGFCAGFNNPGNMNRGLGAGRGFGGGRGGGWGHRHWFQATGLTGWQRAAQGWPAWGNYGRFFQPFFGAGKTTHEQELALLRDQEAQLKDSLDEIHRRMEELASLVPAKPAVETAK